MKNKIITTAIVAGMVALASFGRTPKEIIDTIDRMYDNGQSPTEFYNGITKQEWRDIFEDAISKGEKGTLKMHPAIVIKGFGLMFSMDKSFTDEYDEKFCNNGFYCPFLKRYYITPKCVDLYISSNINTEVSKDLLCQMVKKYKCGPQQLHKNATLPEYINSFALTFAAGFHDNGVKVEQWKTRTLLMAEKQMKRVMRQQGKSFVSDGKTNPFQDEIDALATALNAPKFSGLKEWIAKWFPSYQWREIPFLTDEKLNKLKDDIFYGEKTFDASDKCILQVHLGLDKCNEFIIQYNGDQK